MGSPARQAVAGSGPVARSADGARLIAVFAGLVEPIGRSLPPNSGDVTATRPPTGCSSTWCAAPADPWSSKRPTVTRSTIDDYLDEINGPPREDEP